MAFAFVRSNDWKDLDLAQEQHRWSTTTRGTMEEEERGGVDRRLYVYSLTLILQHRLNYITWPCSCPLSYLFVLKRVERGGIQKEKRKIRHK